MFRFSHFPVDVRHPTERPALNKAAIASKNTGIVLPMTFMSTPLSWVGGWSVRMCASRQFPRVSGGGVQVPSRTERGDIVDQCSRRTSSNLSRGAGSRSEAPFRPTALSTVSLTFAPSVRSLNSRIPPIAAVARVSGNP